MSYICGMNLFIYVLRDPQTNEIRYCGYTTKSLKTRLWGHLSEANRSRNKGRKKPNWIISLRENGLKPIIELVDTANTFDDLMELEKYWIAKLRTDGCDLLNGDRGGGGFYDHNKGDYQYHMKEVYQYDTDGNFIRGFRSIKEAAEYLDTHPSCITRCTKDKEYTRMAGGYIWSDELKEKIEVNPPPRGMEGKKMSEEHLERHREMVRNIKWSKESIEKRSNTVSIPILQYSMDGDLIRKWDSAKQIREELGIKLEYSRYKETPWDGFWWCQEREFDGFFENVFVKDWKTRRGKASRVPIRLIETGEEFISLQEAAKAKGIVPSSISQNLNGKSNSTSVGSWEYV